MAKTKDCQQCRHFDYCRAPELIGRLAFEMACVEKGAEAVVHDERKWKGRLYHFVGVSCYQYEDAKIEQLRSREPRADLLRPANSRRAV